MSAYLFDPSSNAVSQASVSNSYMVTLSSTSVRTIIGNNLAANQSFQGFLREMRFWSMPRTLQDIQSLRYQSIPYNSQLRTYFAGYAMAASGFGS